MRQDQELHHAIVTKFKSMCDCSDFKHCHEVPGEMVMSAVTFTILFLQWASKMAVAEGCKPIDSTVKLYNLQTNIFIQPAKGHVLPQMCEKENENSHNHIFMNKLVRLGLHWGEGASFCRTEHWAKVYKDPREQHCKHSSMSHLLHIVTQTLHRN